ncbi:MAG: hypothetical protein RL091_3743 [Verrucomicrobiota bacterium]
MNAPPFTIILDEPCSRLRDAVAAIAPVFVFKSTHGFFSSPQQAVGELAEQLALAGLEPPYLYVAASFGGYAALTYASLLPDSLVGLVLVDASHPQQTGKALAAIPAEIADTPPMVRFITKLKGFGPVWNESCAAVAAIKSVGSIPLIVLAAGHPDMPDEMPEGPRQALIDGWHDLQRQHAALSTRGQIRIVPEAGHDLVKLAPEAVLAAIRDLARTSFPRVSCEVAT